MQQPATPQATPASIGRRFHCNPVPTILACSGLRNPICFSHVVSGRAMPAPTLPPPVDDAFSIHVHHAPFDAADIWLQGRHTPLKQVAGGSVLIFDLRTVPIAHTHQALAFSRFQISRSAIDELAYEHGMRRVPDLRFAGAVADPVAKHLSLALLNHVEHMGVHQDKLFADAIGNAFFVHIACKYGGANAVATAPRTGLLAPWQARRVADWVEANLDQPVGIASLAALVDLSPSYFARAFVASFNMPPHKWVMHRRIEHAKKLLQDPKLQVVDVAMACGFADQSHFTRVFSRVAGQAPVRWRRALAP